MQKIAVKFSLVMLSLSLVACQTPQSTRVIAKTFNMTTALQQRLMDRDAPTTVIVQKNIAYYTAPDLHIDVYQPEKVSDMAPRPTIVWIHGGGWISGSKAHARGYFKRLAAAGYNVVALQYPLAPQYIYPTQLQYIDRALEFVRQNAVSLHLDAKQLYLAGDSAGANLVSHYAALVSNPTFAAQSNVRPTTLRQDIKGLILHCGIYDLNAFVDTAPDEMRVVEWGVYQLVQAYTGQRREDSEFLRQLSPIQHITADYPPVLISGGNKDFLTKTQSLPFVAVLKQQQIPLTAVFYPDAKAWLLHEYQFFLNQEASQETLQKTLDFLAQYSIKKPA